MADKLRLCSLQGCKAKPHVENCPKCFGFGFTENGALISAGEALSFPLYCGYIKCDVCGGVPLRSIRMETAGGMVNG